MRATLRQFGLEHCDLPTMLWNVTTMLKFLCLNIDPRNKKSISFIFYIGLLLVSACYYYVYFISMAWFVFVRCRETGDVFAAIVVLSLGFSSETSMTKLWCMFFKRNKLKKLLSDLLACDDEVLPNSRFANHMKMTLRVVKKRAIIVWTVINLNGIIYVIIPFFFSERRHIDNVFEFLGYGSMVTMKTSPYYEIAYSTNVVGVFATCYPSANISALFIIVAGYIEAQMLALTQELKLVWEDAVNYHDNSYAMIRHLKDAYRPCVENQNVYQELSRINPNAASSDIEVTSRAISHIRHSSKLTSYNMNKFGNSFRNSEESIKYKERQIALNMYVRKRLAEIFKSHSMNINLLKQIEGVFQIAIAFEFILMSMGLTAELLGDLGKTLIQIPYALMNLGIDCLIGQRIKDASMAFERAVYDSKWENFDVTNRKTILLMLRNSQKEMKLSAGGVAMLTLECLMGILKTTYSAYTTLRTTMNKK